MTPTTKLRFVERTEIVEADFSTGTVKTKQIRVLQQWWEESPSDLADGVTSYGEWRDVPLEKEQ